MVPMDIITIHFFGPIVLLIENYESKTRANLKECHPPPCAKPPCPIQKNKSGFFGDSWGGLCSEKLCFKNCLHAPQSTHLKTNAGPQNQDLERKNLSSDLNFLALFPCFPREKIRSPTAGFAMSL